MVDLKTDMNDIEKKKREYARQEDIRGAYFRDQTAIIHSRSFQRLKHKTQVFFAPENDHICTRIEHSLHLASISATICKALKLDMELAFAIGLGHDLGHAPFGHCGEVELRKLSGKFNHELHSLRVVDKLEERGKGLNLTYAVRDGIASHCGEKIARTLKVSNSPNNLDDLAKLPDSPSTYEGCVVRMSDPIAFLGRDLEDAMKAKVVAEDMIPEDVKKILGVKNSDIIDTLVNDLINNSLKEGDIAFSKEKYDMLMKLNKFNYKNVYESKDLYTWNKYCALIIDSICKFLCDIFDKYGCTYQKYEKSEFKLERKFGRYLESLSDRYEKEGFNKNIIVSDYIAGMTDQYALECFKHILIKGTTRL